MGGGEQRGAIYAFFEKEMASNQVIQKLSALPENMKISTLNNEVMRRMFNTSELLPDRMRCEIVDDFCQKLCNSGYDRKQSRKIIVGGLTGYERRVTLSKDKTHKKWRPLHESATSTQGRRAKKKLLGKTSWFKGKKKDRGNDDENSVDKKHK